MMVINDTATRHYVANLKDTTKKHWRQKLDQIVFICLSTQHQYCNS